MRNDILELNELSVCLSDMFPSETENVIIIDSSSPQARENIEKLLYNIDPAEKALCEADELMKEYLDLAVQIVMKKPACVYPAGNSSVVIIKTEDQNRWSLDSSCKEITFKLLHEIGHIICGKQETAADAFALLMGVKTGYLVIEDGLVVAETRRINAEKGDRLHDTEAMLKDLTANITSMDLARMSAKEIKNTVMVYNNKFNATVS